MSCLENENQKLKDMEILAKIKKGESKIEDYDNDTKVRLIELCSERIRQIEEKICRINSGVRK